MGFLLGYKIYKRYENMLCLVRKQIERWEFETNRKG